MPAAYAQLSADHESQSVDDIGCPQLISKGINSERLDYVSTCKLPTDKGHFFLHAYRYTNKHGHQVRGTPGRHTML